MMVAVFFNVVELKLETAYEGGKEVRDMVLGYVPETLSLAD